MRFYESLGVRDDGEKVQSFRMSVAEEPFEVNVEGDAWRGGPDKGSLKRFETGIFPDPVESTLEISFEGAAFEKHFREAAGLQEFQRERCRAFRENFVQFGHLERCHISRVSWL